MTDHEPEYIGNGTLGCAMWVMILVLALGVSALRLSDGCANHGEEKR